MKNKTNPTVAILAILIATFCVTQGKQTVGIYAKVDFRSDSDSSAKIFEFTDVTQGNNAYAFRNFRGTRVLVDKTKYRGAIYYPSAKSLSTLDLSKKKLKEMQEFVKKFPASNRYLKLRITQLSQRIGKMESLEKNKTPPQDKGGERIASLTLKNGKIYKNVKVTKLPDGVTILHQGGVVTVPLEELPDSLVTKLGGFDADEVKEYRKTPQEKWRDQEKVLKQKMAEKELIMAKDDDERKSVLFKKLSQLVKPIKPAHGKIDRIIRGRILNVLNDGILISVGVDGVCKVEMNSESFVDDEIVSDIVERTNRRFKYTAVNGALKTVPVYVPVSNKLREYFDLNDAYLSTKNLIERQIETINNNALNRAKKNAALLKLKERKFLEQQAKYRTSR